MSAMVMWLIAGVVLFFAEMGVPGVGLMFSGLAALTVGMLLNFYFIPMEDTVLQALIFVTSTALWSLVLWKPLQKYKLGKTGPAYNNMIGETAIVAEKGINKNHGEVVWSGAVMKAKLTDNSTAEKLESGAAVIIQDIKGNILTVAPK